MLELKELDGIRIDIRILTKFCPNLCSFMISRNNNCTNPKPEETTNSFQPKNKNILDPIILKKLSVLQLHCIDRSLSEPNNSSRK